MITTSLTIGPPDTGADCIREQRRHFSSAATCRSSKSLFPLAIATKYCAFGELFAIVFGEADPPYAQH
jgi:hypothetical protein